VLQVLKANRVLQAHKVVLVPLDQLVPLDNLALKVLQEIRVLLDQMGYLVKLVRLEKLEKQELLALKGLQDQMVPPVLQVLLVPPDLLELKVNKVNKDPKVQQVKWEDLVMLVPLVQMEAPELLDLKDPLVILVLWELLVIMVPLEPKVDLVQLDSRVHKALKDQQVLQDLKVLQAMLAHKADQEITDLVDQQDQQVPKVLQAQQVLLLTSVKWLMGLNLLDQRRKAPPYANLIKSQLVEEQFVMLQMAKFVTATPSPIKHIPCLWVGEVNVLAVQLALMQSVALVAQCPTQVVVILTMILLIIKINSMDNQMDAKRQWIV